jgi:NAD(P)-dependent dehydrogenase (short-subunit alcohol dehydrogenase family)
VSSGGAYTVKANPNDIYCSKIPKYDGTLFYAFAKRVQIVLTEMWAEKLKAKGITVNAMHPGWATTEGVLEAMPGFHEQNKDAFRTVEQGADTIVFLASNQDRVGSKTGLFWFDRSPVKTHMSMGGTDSSAKERELLWKVCSETVGGIAHGG